ncbi:histidine phosphatase family protein [Lapillicoccus jejuensis]|uniref:Broad specificity phosphatase PhoE n=1 Tax=Lapillicoccus jejuensis TaxID=402171 RepID=A0A542DYQ1_9MICO|nr:histidine phosphatase family protein [Lapillicoccus jejuensis]TQJ08223.1 broad specificity phosphatase PhoE [Lapillicoccus jejuensis]
MRRLLYVSHPEVLVDPAVPVPRWGLSPVGAERARRFATATALLDDVGSVWSSAETKARETAALLVADPPMEIYVRGDLGELDRSATGYLPREEFERVADECFAAPEDSVRGWERAVDAQTRTVRAVHAVLTDPRAAHGDVLVVGHGGVGTLLFCRVAGLPIAREHDQPGSGGNVLTFDLHEDSRLVPTGGWVPFEHVS